MGQVLVALTQLPHPVVITIPVPFTLRAISASSSNCRESARRDGKGEYGDFSTGRSRSSHGVILASTIQPRTGVLTSEGSEVVTRLRRRCG